MRLIDLDDDRHCYVGNDGEYERWNIAPEAPTVDAVEVVRCKDCRFYRPSQWEGDIACCLNVQNGLISFPGESDYCSRCERKGEE